MNDLTTLANINDITEGRNEAIKLWIDLYDNYHATREKAAAICIGGNFSLTLERGYNREGLDVQMSIAFLQSGERARAEFLRLLTRYVDTRCWSEMLDHLGFGELLDAKAKQEWAESLRANPPEFTPENCAATFGNMWENRGFYYIRGVAECFSKLDRRFRSHGGFRYGNRVIINDCFDPQWLGHWKLYERRDTINDIERTLYELAVRPAPRPHDYTASQKYEMQRRGQDIPEWDPPLTHLIEERMRHGPVPSTIEGEYLAAKVFKNGNVHLWFRDKELHLQLNHILAQYYGETLGDGYDSHEAPANPSYHVTPAKNFGEFFTSPETARIVVDRYGSLQKGCRVLEPSAGKGALALAALDHGAIVDCIEIQPGHAHELAISGRYNNVQCADFLQIEPPLSQDRLYDAIVMNPPFDRGRDCDHVRHAWKFLKPGGQLLAIMSARAEFGDDARHKALHALVETASPIYGRDKWHDLPERSFAHAGTMVNTVVLAIHKPRA